MFFRKKDPSQLRLGEIEGFLRNKFSNTIKNEEDRSINATNSIYSKFNELRAVLEELEKKPSSKTFTASVKNSYCDRSLGAIDGVKEPGRVHISAFVQMARIVCNAVSEINYKELRHLQEFKSDMSRISQLSKAIKKELDELESMTGKSTMKKIEEIGSLVAEISSSRKTFDDMETMLRDSGASITQIKDEIENYKKRLETLRSSDSGNGVTSELRRVEAQASVLKQKIATDLSGMDKLFKKMKHEGEKSFDVDNVFESFVKDNLDLKDATEKLLEAISVHRITTEPKQKEKLQSIYRNMNELYDMREEYIDLTEMINDLKNSIRGKAEPVEAEIKKIKEELEEKENELETLEKKRDSRMSERKRLEEKVQKTADDIQKKLSAMLEREIVVQV